MTIEPSSDAPCGAARLPVPSPDHRRSRWATAAVDDPAVAGGRVPGDQHDTATGTAPGAPHHTGRGPRVVLVNETYPDTADVSLHWYPDVGELLLSVGPSTAGFSLDVATDYALLAALVAALGSAPVAPASDTLFEVWDRFPLDMWWLDADGDPEARLSLVWNRDTGVAELVVLRDRAVFSSSPGHRRALAALRDGLFSLLCRHPFVPPA